MTNQLLILEDCRFIVNAIFLYANKYPALQYTLNQQIIKSAVSIGSNIAEGNQREGKDRNHFFNIVLGSLEECRFQVSCYSSYNQELEDKFDKIKATIIKLKRCSK